MFDAEGGESGVSSSGAAHRGSDDGDRAARQIRQVEIGVARRRRAPMTTSRPLGFSASRGRANVAADVSW